MTPHAKHQDSLDAQVGFLTKRFSEAINGNDPEALATVFEPDALLVVKPGKVIKISERQAGTPMLLDARLGALYVSDDLAMLLVSWDITQDSGQGYATRSTGRSTDIARRDAHNIWRCIIDNGSGGGPADAVRSIAGSDDHLDSLIGHLAAKLRRAVLRRDLEDLTSCFEPKAVLVTEAGVVRTRRELAAALEKFTLSDHFESAVRHAYVADDVALIIEDWSLAGERTEGEEGTATHVARRGPDGSWRYVIYNSLGTAPYRDSTETVQH